MDLENLIKVGKEMGLQGTELQKFISEQQSLLRDKKAQAQAMDAEQEAKN